jgi:hypothetical protein
MWWWWIGLLQGDPIKETIKGGRGVSKMKMKAHIQKRVLNFGVQAL